MTEQPPDWALDIPSAPIHQERQTQLERPFTPQQMQQFGNELIQQFLKRVVLAVVGSFIPGVSSFDQLHDWAANIPGLAQIIDLIENFPLNGENIVGSIMHLLTTLPVGNLTDDEPNLQAAKWATFSAGSIAGNADWSVDLTRSRTDDDTGAAKVVADAVLPRALHSQDIFPVSPGKTIQETIFVSHEGYSGSGPAVLLQVIPYAASGPGLPVTIAGYTPTSADVEWPGFELTGSWIVPDGVTGYRKRYYIPPAAGSFYLDDANGKQTGKLRKEWIDGLPEDLQDLLGRWQLTVDTIINAVNKVTTAGNQLEDLFEALQSIDPTAVAGLLGPENVAAAIQQFLDSLVSGAVGEEGTGASLPELRSIMQQISSWANRGNAAKDVTDTRTNTSATGGLGISERSNFDLGLADAWIAVTPTASAISFDYIEGDMPLGAISWIGYGVSGITAVYVNVWKVNLQTGALALAHSSGNVVSIIADAGSAAPGAFIQYELPDPIDLKISELFGYEVIVVGGTHNIRGRVYNLPAHPTAPIAKLAATRNASASPATPPSSIAKASVTWSDNAPWIGIAIDTGSGAGHHDPDWRYLGTKPTSLPVPKWADAVDGIVVGPGGDAHAGIALGINGDPGEPGVYNAVTWVRGTDFGDNAIITFTPGDPATLTISTPGGDTHTVSAVGGADGSGTGFLSTPVGRGPETFTYNGQKYPGGLDQKVMGANGIAPGGAGNGGKGGLFEFQPGGHGAPGGGWVYMLSLIHI